MASLIELLEVVGLENVTVQALHECATGATMKKGGDTEVKFITGEITPGDMVGKMCRTALIVWMDAEKFDKALKEIKGK